MTIWCGKCHGVFKDSDTFRVHKCLGAKLPTTAPVVKA